MSSFFLVVAFLSLIYCQTLSAQVFLGSNHSIKVDGSTLSIYQSASFSIGYGSSCPPLDTFNIMRSTNTITVDVFYDASGNWPQSGCSRTDTLQDSLSACDPCTLIVNSHIIDENDTIVSTPIDTFYNADNDTSYFSVLNLLEIEELDKIDVYPNPTSGEIILQGVNFSSLPKVTLYSLAGAKIKTFTPTSDHFDLSVVEEGFYFLHLEFSKKRLYILKIIKV